MRIVPLLLLLAVCFVLTAGKLLNETIKGTLEKETTRKGGGSDIAVALIEAGASILTSNGNPPNTWQLPSGTKINAEDCWTEPKAGMIMITKIEYGNTDVVIRRKHLSV